MTDYVAEMSAAWHAWAAWGRPAHPRLTRRVRDAGRAARRCTPSASPPAAARPHAALNDPHSFFDTSSYGAARGRRDAARRRRRPPALRLRPARRRAAGARRRSGRPSSTPSPRSTRPGSSRRRSSSREAHDRTRPARPRPGGAPRARRATSPPTRSAGSTSSSIAPTPRTYAELHRDDHVAVWLICWMDDHDTGFHDHDLSGGRGRRRRRRGARGAARARRRARRARGLRPASRSHFGPSDIHRVAPRRRAPGGHGPRLLAAAVADGRLRGARRPASCSAGRSPTRRSCARSARRPVWKRGGPARRGWGVARSVGKGGGGNWACSERAQSLLRHGVRGT